MERITVYPKKCAHDLCFAVLCCGYTLTDFPISIRLTSLALWQSNDCPSARKATLMNMDKYFMWINYERLHNHNKAEHNKTVCIFLGIYCSWCTGASHLKEQWYHGMVLFSMLVTPSPVMWSFNVSLLLSWTSCFTNNWPAGCFKHHHINLTSLEWSLPHILISQLKHTLSFAWQSWFCWWQCHMPVLMEYISNNSDWHDSCNYKAAHKCANWSVLKITRIPIN